MSSVLTRAQLRDAVRRELGQIPTFDLSGSTADIGIQPTTYPEPRNAALNQAIDFAVEEILAFAKVTKNATSIGIPVPAQTANGPYQFSMWDLSPQGNVTTVNHLTWMPTSTTVQRLLPTSREELDRNGTLWEGMAPGTPTNYWIEGDLISLYPAPSSAGTLSMQANQSAWSEASNQDGEVPRLVPIEYVQLLVQCAAFNIAVRYTGNVEMSNRAKMLKPLVEDGKSKFRYEHVTANENLTARIVPKTGRIGYGYY